MIIKELYSHMWVKHPNKKAYFIAHFMYVELGKCKLEPKELIEKYKRILEKVGYEIPGQ